MPEGNETTSVATPDANGAAEGGQGDASSPEKSFTQADLDRIVQDRLARERQKYADYDTFKDKASRFDELEAANQSELEKATKRAEQAEQAAAEATRRAQATAMRAAVVAEATKAGAVDPDAVLALIPKDAVTVGDDGQVTGAEEAVKTLMGAKPYLVGAPAKPATGSADGGARGSGPGPDQLTRDDLKTMSSEQIVKAKAEGRLTELLGG